METLKQFGDKHVSMKTHGQQYNTAIYNINFELGHTTKRSVYKIAGKLEGKRPLGRCRHQWEDTIR
jgi:hypothetical protein